MEIKKKKKWKGPLSCSDMAMPTMLQGQLYLQDLHGSCPMGRVDLTKSSPFRQSQASQDILTQHFSSVSFEPKS